MPLFESPVTQIIRQRYSCRAYDKTPIAPEQAEQLAASARSIRRGPLATPLRFELAVALDHDAEALRGLGTYGLIKNAAGFIIGACGPGEKNLEDFGYALEAIVLRATDIGLGTCWLGGNFTRSTFSRRIRATGDEIVPAVAAVGVPAPENRNRDRLRRLAKSDTRLPWQELFFDGSFAQSLSPERAGAYAEPLEMVRLAPSSHNGQPWRVVRVGEHFHFYLRRSKKTGPTMLASALLGLADLPRVDMGIAMCHFELAVQELGLAGTWVSTETALSATQRELGYIVTWDGGSQGSQV